MASDRYKTAFITGASRRVGRAIALHLATQGWNIAIHCRTQDKDSASLLTALKKLGVKTACISGDLSDKDALSSLIPAVNKQIGVISCLINNASLFEKDALQSLTQASFDAHMQVNLYAPMVLSAAFAKQLPAKAEGSIINLLDGLEGWSLSPEFLSYTLSKGALAEFTRRMVEPLAPRIRINAVGLGATLPSKHDKKDTFKKIAAMTPLKRTSNPQEVCDAITYILNTPSLTGQIISLSGGV